MYTPSNPAAPVSVVFALLLCGDPRNEIADVPDLRPLLRIAMGWAKRAESEGAPVGSG